MSVFKKETADFIFSLRHDNSLLIWFKEGKPDFVSPFSEVTDYIKAAKDEKGRALEVEVMDLFGTINSSSGRVVQDVLSAFSYTFKTHEDQREQLMEGLRYFIHAKHYKLFESLNPEPLLNKYKEDYNTALERYPAFLKEHDELNEKARVLHLNDPLVATTGLLVYASIDANWFIYETRKTSEERPEYLYSIDRRDLENNILVPDVFMGSQKECINQVMIEQIENYGISYENVLKKRQENAALRTMLKELEIVTDVPADQRLEAKEAAAEQAEQESAVLDQNLTRLKAYATIKE